MSRTKVVVIEDNSDDQLLLADSLGRIAEKNFESFCCDSLREGLEVISLNAPDVILLDLSLPDSLGIETVKSVHKKFPSLPIIVLTGNDDELLALQAIDAGAQDYLVKGGINSALLNRSINYAIERHRISMVSKWSSALVENFNYAFIGQTVDGIVLTWNSGAEQLFGYKSEEIIGESIQMLMPEGLNQFREIFQVSDDAMKNGELSSREAHLTCKDGTKLVVKVFVSPITNTEGEVTALSVLMRDISQERKTEDDLKDKDHRLSFAVSSAKLGLWDWDVKSNELKLGDGMLELLELEKTQDSPTLKQFLNLVHTSDRKLVKDLLYQKGSFDFDFRLVLANRPIRYLQIKGEIFADENNTPTRMAGVCLDITDRKLAEEALRISEETLKLALDASHMGVWEFSLEDRITSRSMLHDGIFGASSEKSQWTVKSFMQYVHPEDREFVKKALNEALESGKFNLECRIINKDNGTTKWIYLQSKRSLDGGGKARMIGTVQDITESKALELLARQAHERSNQILHAVVEYAPTGVAMLDSQMKITSTNAAFRAMTGKEAAAMIGNQLDHVLPYLEIKKACPFLMNGEPAQISRLFAPTPDGNERFWDLSIWPVKVANQITGAVLQLNDRTHTVLLERQRDDFVASVAHDIKNPLVGASRLLEILCNDAARASSVNHESYLNVLKDSTENLLSLVQNLVDVYRYETLAYPCQLEKIQTVTLIESCVKQMRMFAETRNVQMLSEIGVGAEILDADAIGIRRVLMNLLHNAVKFNRPGGKVMVSVKREKSKVLLTVADTGYGMSEVEKQNLFQRFTQGAEGKRNAGGTGLGLYLSKQIISAHKGSISCNSVLGEGTMFSISLPRLKHSSVKNSAKAAVKA